MPKLYFMDQPNMLVIENTICDKILSILYFIYHCYIDSHNK